jgi:hypothetical protein
MTGAASGKLKALSGRRSGRDASPRRPQRLDFRWSNADGSESRPYRRSLPTARLLLAERATSNIQRPLTKRLQ